MSSQPESITARRLEARFGSAPAEAILGVALDRYEGRIAMASSFGADAAVLLHMLSVTDPSVPVMMLDTALLFRETLDYQRDLSAHLGLRDVRILRPDEAADPDRMLHQRDTDACCTLRKVAPLEKALAGFDAVLTGRKRYQTRARARMEAFETDDAGHLKVNPLAGWSASDIAAYLDTHDLPRHPMVAKGYPSIGCAPCTTRVSTGEDARAGRWRGEDRQECGIHIREDGTIERIAG